MSEVIAPTWAQVVREFFPNATDEHVDYILWNRTGYPTFWERGDIVAQLRKQVAEFHAAVATGKPLCDFCCNTVTAGEWLCAECMSHQTLEAESP